MVGRNQPSNEWIWWKRAKNGRKLVKLGENPNIPYPECERSIKIRVVKQQECMYVSRSMGFCDCFPHLPCTSVNSHSVSYCQTSPDILGQLDVQIVAPSAAPKRSPVGHGSKKMPGALTLPQLLLPFILFLALTCPFLCVVLRGCVQYFGDNE